MKTEKAVKMFKKMRQIIDKRLVAYKNAVNYPNVNYYNFKNQLDNIKDILNSTI